MDVFLSLTDKKTLANLFKKKHHFWSDSGRTICPFVPIYVHMLICLCLHAFSFQHLWPDGAGTRPYPEPPVSSQCPVPNFGQTMRERVPTLSCICLHTVSGCSPISAAKKSQDTKTAQNQTQHLPQPQEETWVKHPLQIRWPEALPNTQVCIKRKILLNTAIPLIKILWCKILVIPLLHRQQQISTDLSEFKSAFTLQLKNKDIPIVGIYFTFFCNLCNGWLSDLQVSGQKVWLPHCTADPFTTLNSVSCHLTLEPKQKKKNHLRDPRHYISRRTGKSSSPGRSLDWLRI